MWRYCGGSFIQNISESCQVPDGALLLCHLGRPGKGVLVGEFKLEWSAFFIYMCICENISHGEPYYCTLVTQFLTGQSRLVTAQNWWQKIQHRPCFLLRFATWPKLLHVEPCYMWYTFVNHTRFCLNHVHYEWITATENLFFLLSWIGYISMQCLWSVHCQLHKSCARKNPEHSCHNFNVRLLCASSTWPLPTLHPAPDWPRRYEHTSQADCDRPWKLRTKPIISPTRPNPKASPVKPFFLLPAQISSSTIKSVLWLAMGLILRLVREAICQ